MEELYYLLIIVTLILLFIRVRSINIFNKNEVIYKMKSVGDNKYIYLIAVLFMLLNVAITSIEAYMFQISRRNGMYICLYLLFIIYFTLNIELKYIISDDGLTSVSYGNIIIRSYSWEEIILPIKCKGNEIEFEISCKKASLTLRGTTGQSKEEIVEFLLNKMRHHKIKKF